MVDHQPEAESGAGKKLFMVYGLSNLTTLAQILPVKIDGQVIEDHQTKKEYFQSMSTAVTLYGWTRCFAKEHATIVQSPDKAVYTFAVLLD